MYRHNKATDEGIYMSKGYVFFYYFRKKKIIIIIIIKSGSLIRFFFYTLPYRQLLNGQVNKSVLRNHQLLNEYAYRNCFEFMRKN